MRKQAPRPRLRESRRRGQYASLTPGFSPRALWRESRSLRASAGAIGGFICTVLFALYNGALGVRHTSLWHGSICLYYILLSTLRGSLFAASRKVTESQKSLPDRRRIFVLTSALMLVMNLALILPLALMVRDERPIQMGLIPAIASAAYTTYKLSAAAVRLKRTKGALFVRELRVIQLADALVSILVLQNTLIVAVEGGISERMRRLSAIGSAAIFLLLLVLTLLWLIQGAKHLWPRPGPGHRDVGER